MFERIRYPARVTWGSHWEEFDLKRADPKIQELLPAAGMAVVKDPVIPEVTHSHQYGPLHGIDLSNATFDPNRGLVSIRGRRILEFGQSAPTGWMDGVLGQLWRPRSINGRWTPLRNASFAHWILEDLPSLLLSKAKMGVIGALVPGNSPAWQRRILDQVQVPWTLVSQPVSAEHLVFTDKHTDYGWPRMDLAGLVVDCVRERITRREQTGLKIYISNSGGKRVSHAPRMLEDLAVERGYMLIHPQELDWLDQASLFASAKEVVAPHGGALANLIFCQPSTVVVELMTPEYANPYFEVLSTHVNLKYERRWIPQSKSALELNSILS